MVIAMREMKDSCIQGIDTVPNNWNRIQLEHCANIIRGGSPRPIEHYMSDTEDGYSWIKIGDTVKGNKYIASVKERIIPAGLSKTRYVRKGTLLLTNSMSYGEPYILSVDGCIHDGWLAFSDLRNLDKEFLYYFLVSPACRVQFEKSSDGGVVQNLNIDKVKHSIIYYPPIDEQMLIVSFLDTKCSEIDALSADIQSEIDTLEAYKRSVIAETVTKGLDKNAPMKDSGTDWLGDIPKHWDTKRGKYVFVQKNDKGNSKSLILLSPTQNYGVIPQDLYEELSGFSAVKLNEKTDFNSLKTVHKGAFVISLRSFQGGFEYSEYEGVVSPAYQVFYPSIPACDAYYKYLFKTQVFIDKMNSYTMSLRDGKNIAFADFGRTYIPIPPVREQEEIAIKLDFICSELNTIIKEKQEQLKVLADYKKSMIYEYVTGKKEVSYGEF